MGFFPPIGCASRETEDQFVQVSRRIRHEHAKEPSLLILIEIGVPGNGGKVVLSCLDAGGRSAALAFGCLPLL
jgi:hypothetical protein